MGKKPLPNLLSGCLPVFSPKSFLVLAPTFISLIRSEVIFLGSGFCPILVSREWATLSYFFVWVVIFC